MREKLTKNDSMSIKQHKFEVAVSVFKALLHRRGLYQSYFHAWSCENWRDIDVPSDIAWEDWAKRGDVEEWVSDAFIWAGSSIPSSVWAALSVDWEDYCNENLNK